LLAIISAAAMNKYIILLSLSILISIKVSAQNKLKIYGGKNHDQFIGCIDCSNNDLNSIWCVLGDYGSTHNPKSIWNEKGIYGSKTSKFSPYNKKAKYPPIILDGKGKSYGYLTINKNNPKRTTDLLAKEIIEDRDQIVKDIPKYYAHTFHDRND